MMCFLKKLHKWVGLLIGVQVLLWLLSGLLMSLFDPLEVSGKKWVSTTAAESQLTDSAVLLEPSEFNAKQIEGALGIDLKVRHGRAVYRVRLPGGESLLDAADGSIIVFDKADAERLARQDFNGEGEIISSEQGTAPDIETRNSIGAYWRVNFSDQANTSIYVSASTGDILERRNWSWRVRDFFWMLHIMDYSGRQDFNHPLIITIALIAIWLGISGFILLFGSFSRFDFFFLNVFSKREQAIVTLMGPAAGDQKQLTLRKGGNLFLSLATHDVDLASICGGGGECGKCRVQFKSTKIPTANEIELGLIPKRLREQGYRLACQHKVVNSITLHLPKGTLFGGQ